MVKTFKQFLKEANENSKPIPSQNKLFGFYNELYTIFNGDEKKIKSVWNEAFNLISDISNLSSKQIRDILDSKSGRWLADTFYNDIEKGDLSKAFKQKFDNFDKFKKWFGVRI